MKGSGRSVAKPVLPDRSKSDGQDRPLHKNRRDVFVQNTARRNWQGKCFSKGRYNNVMEITAAVSSRTKGELDACMQKSEIS
jgi:hypothetical protein